MRYDSFIIIKHDNREQKQTQTPTRQTEKVRVKILTPTWTVHKFSWNKFWVSFCSTSKTHSRRRPGFIFRRKLNIRSLLTLSNCPWRKHRRLIDDFFKDGRDYMRRPSKPAFVYVSIVFREIIIIFLVSFLFVTEKNVVMTCLSG